MVSAILLLTLLGLMVLVPLWTFKRFGDAKAAWQRVRGGERDARTHGRFVIHGGLFGVGMVVISAFLAQATFSIWHQVATGGGLFVLGTVVVLCLLALVCRKGRSRE
ncbi:TPA: hypothetical protein UMF74_000775 [Stenotrophomonas maltophilia]|jgi:hypothetical protein|uniref:hypothetical protein n=1 Tax=Xanthomonas citri TaxID=346 RepID=UPI000591089E|nr:hypothetical protein [Xanthomonas citri]EKT4065504.1 hypothetical protein [Stenotrophomonas maltophilia]MBH1493664.1 hypothetical protein [Stenotrophomonas maltophilia]MBN4961161.1 hypothetical protein [Stenotrophomonas maltophilia]OMG05167.1 hypothetical protein LN96_10330 [Xanthomonas citri pv. citri]PIB21005.1 hypothetical protein AA099_07445 [Xanthomonas citri pv. citri]